MRCEVTKCQAEVQVQHEIYIRAAGQLYPQPKVLAHTLRTYKIECFMYLFVLNSGTLDLGVRCVCLPLGPGIIPPVRLLEGVTLNRQGAGVAECTNSFNSWVCYRHAVIVNIMDDE